jgi:carboxymethylenebutenolidase
MCFDADARPPLPPIRGAALDSRDLTLTAADGTQVAAHAARAAEPTGAGMVILPDVRGLHPFFDELALRFAEAGVDAIAFDYFSRTAGTGKRDDAFDYQAHVPQMRHETLNQDVAAAAAYLRTPDGGAVDRLFTVGFCLGGRASMVQAARPELGLAGVIGFYGFPTGQHRTGTPAPADLAPSFTCPVLAIFGGADQAIPGEVRDEYDKALTDAGIEHRIVVYEGAPHSFFDRKAEEYADASADSWRQVLAFMGVGENGT